MKKILLMLCAAWAAVAVAQVGDLQRSTPAAEGVDPAAVNRFIDSLQVVKQTDIHHVMVVRHGKVIAEAHPAPYRAEDAHTLYSCSKTFTSLAVGLAVEENRLRLTDRVAAFFPEKLPDSISPRLAQMTVRDLLIMGAGIKPDWIMRNNNPDWITEWLAKPVTDEPGTRFQYDSMCSFMLAAIVQRVTGMTMLDYLKKHIFNDMHITEVDWEQSPDGINTGGWGLRLQAESLAKAGILMLDRGKWNGKQLVPAHWIDEAVTAHINYDWVKPCDAPTEGNRGYGYQVWRCKNDKAFRADGAFGQYIVCIPEADMVVVITGYSNDGHGELACIWKHLMPGVDNVAGNATIAQQRLEKSCNAAALPVLKGKKTGAAMPAQLNLDANKHGISTIAVGPDCSMTLAYSDGRRETIALGYGKYLYSSLNDVPPYSIEAMDRFKGLKRNFEAAGCYAWTSKQVFAARIEYVNWISATTFSIDLARGTVTITDNFAQAKPETIHFAR
ncbi:serine hydrolase domain-containing protein [Sodaliphilus sp.]|uniref:serine hydrolase domain-containing protein n=1 Tax=Sodaliphilus sp. TaxID=2815818 RepID=UPI00388E77B8